ncbi:hypothetical protein F4677DRAFT_466130 [Hypoxylon crocopeplum]|nr:hypothetical protein F4677DRAFT_466130 [Hypoxylon crocopeplum]
MDPLSMIQIVGAAISVGDVVLRCITRLSSLQSKYDDAPILVSTMMGQLCMVRVALSQLSGSASSGLDRNPRYQQIALQVDSALHSFYPLMTRLQQHLDRLDERTPSEMTAIDRIAFVWSEKEMNSFSTLLDRQVNALNLLLQAMQCPTWIQQREVIDREESQSILRLASSSIVVLDDRSSFASDGTDAITMFEFDDIILRSRLYQKTQQSHLKQAIRAEKPLEAGGPSTNLHMHDTTITSNHQATENSHEGGSSSRPPNGSYPPVIEPRREPSASLGAQEKTTCALSNLEASNSTAASLPEGTGDGRLVRQRSIRLNHWWRALHGREDDTGVRRHTDEIPRRRLYGSQDRSDFTRPKALKLATYPNTFAERRGYGSFLDFMSSDSGLRMV